MDQRLLSSALLSLGLALPWPAYAQPAGGNRGGNHRKPALAEQNRPRRSPAPVRPPMVGPHPRPENPPGRTPTTYRGFPVVERPIEHRGRTIDRRWVQHTYRGRTYERYWPRYRDCAPRFWGVYFSGPTHWVSFQYAWPWIPSLFWAGSGYYYRPYLTYPSPTWFLTDYVFLSTMYGPYEAVYANGYSDGYRDAQVSETEKARIRSQIDDELNRNHTEGEAPATVVDHLHDPDYIYLVSGTVTVPRSGSSQTCTLSKGDLLKTVNAPAEGEASALMKVVKAQNGSCPEASEVFVPLETLQDFQNGFSRAIEDGLGVYETRVGQTS